MPLRRHAELVNSNPASPCWNTDDQLRLIKQILEAEGIDQKRWTPRYLASLIDGWKNRAIWPEKLPQNEAHQFAEGKGKKLYEIYQARLATLNAVDFGDLLLHTIRIFTEHPEVLADYHAKFRYIMVINLWQCIAFHDNHCFLSLIDDAKLYSVNVAYYPD